MSNKKNSKEKNIIRTEVWKQTIGNTLDGNCYLCTDKVNFNNFKVGHIIEKSNGGLTTVDNLKVMCNSCDQTSRVKKTTISKNISQPGIIMQPVAVQKPFSSFNGAYMSTIMLGTKTNNFEKISLNKQYQFLANMQSDFITTKKIVGIDLVDKWSDGTNGRIELDANDERTHIKCVSQLFRGHNFEVTIFY